MLSYNATLVYFLDNSTHDDMNERCREWDDDKFWNQSCEKMGNASILENAAIPINHFNGPIGLIFDTIIMAICELEIFRTM